MLRKKLIFLILALLVLIFFVWKISGYPFSYHEMIFLRNLKIVSYSEVKKIDLGKIMPSDWDVVCESHGYDEPLYLKRYQKAFPTAGGLQNGSWGLIFVQVDGSFELISSNCNSGTEIEFKTDRCILRKDAVLTRKENITNKICTVFYS